MPLTIQDHSPLDFWILGAGKFGQIAVERIRKKYPVASILVVDSDQKALDSLGQDISTKNEPGIEFLVLELTPDKAPDWVVPAIPVHVACQWTLLRLKEQGQANLLPVSKDVEHQVPNPLWGKNGELYASQADFLCPDNCPEPRDRCFKTKLPRENLFDLLKFIHLMNFSKVVIRSHQLTPGVGGIRPESLFKAHEMISKSKGDWLMATACRCHGVIHALQVQ